MSMHWKWTTGLETSMSLLLPSLGLEQKKKRVLMSCFDHHHKSAWQGISFSPNRVIGRCFNFSPSFHLPCCGLAPCHCLAPLHAHSRQWRWILQEIISSEATLTPQAHCLLLMVHPRRGLSGTAETGRLMVCGTPLCQIPGESSSYFEFPLFI